MWVTRSCATRHPPGFLLDVSVKKQDVFAYYGYLQLASYIRLACSVSSCDVRTVQPWCFSAQCQLGIGCTIIKDCRCCSCSSNFQGCCFFFLLCAKIVERCSHRCGLLVRAPPSRAFVRCVSQETRRLCILRVFTAAGVIHKACM